MKNKNKNRFYVYALLDPRKPGRYVYETWEFDHEPFYVGKGSGNRIICHTIPRNLVGYTVNYPSLKGEA